MWARGWAGAKEVVWESRWVDARVWGLGVVSAGAKGCNSEARRAVVWASQLAQGWESVLVARLAGAMARGSAVRLDEESAGRWALAWALSKVEARAHE